MKDDKEFEEIEIEQIDLDIDQNYDISIDVSSIGDIEHDKEESFNVVSDFDNLSLGEEKSEVSSDISLEPSFESISQTELKEETKEEISLGQEEIGDIEMVSISNDELDAILGGASVKEEEEEGVNIDNLITSSGETLSESSEVSYSEEILGEPLDISGIGSSVSDISSSVETEDIFSGLESKDIGISEGLTEDMFSSAQASITSEEEVFTSREESILGVEETTSFEEKESKPEIVVMSTEEYNKMVEESKSIPIIEKPLEETFEITEETEEFETKEKISPEEVGISGEFQDFELKEFEEIPEDVVVAKTLEGSEVIEPMEVIDSGFEDVGILSEEEVSAGIESDILESGSLETPVETKEEKFELVDDISIDVDLSPQSEVSVMPDEVGIEEISVEPSEVSVSEDITGISFADTSVVSEEVEVKEETSMEVFEEVSDVGFSEITTKEERISKVESAIDELSEEEKEDIKKVLLYLDKLLENLPEDKIKEFAQSEYYDIYVKLFDKLNLK